MTRIISIVGGLQPTAPTIGTATGGSASASVAFTASSYIGKGTITYTATSSPGGITGTSATSPITVSGLTNGTAYTFTVVGNTNYGVASAASASSNSVTPAVPYSPAYDFIAQASGSMSSVSFTSLPSGYASFRVLFNCFIGQESIGYIQFNGNTTSGAYSEYSMGWSFANQPANYGSSSSSQQQRRYAAGNFSTKPAQVQIDITNPDQSQEHQVFMYSGYGGLGNDGANTWSNGNFNSATPITSITLGGGNGPSPTNTWSNSIVTLYGRKRGTAL